MQVESYFESGKWHNIIHRMFTTKNDTNMEVISNLFWHTTPVFSEHYLVVQSCLNSVNLEKLSFLHDHN